VNGLLRSTAALVVTGAALGAAASQPPQSAGTADVNQRSTPLTIGETFAIASKVLNETRRINIYLPAAYSEPAPVSLPVLYMPDGGVAEDFLHIAGLVQVSVGNGTMRPFILAGIENTERRRDMTGPTENPEDRKIAPRVGGSAAFRRFIKDELKPAIQGRYRTTVESAIVGESLAGLFVMETFFLDPEVFDTYIAFDPSLWWNNHELVDSASQRLSARTSLDKTLYVAFGSDSGLDTLTAQLAGVLRSHPSSTLRWHIVPMPEEKHATIYHPAALRAFRTLFKP